jgi:tRNA(adenine34) deaminase
LKLNRHFVRAMTDFMNYALEQAKAAATRGETPVGAVLVSAQGSIIAANGNRVREHKDAMAHAEMLVLQEAYRVFGNERLSECDLYVTLEPCAMCAGAISLARIRRLYYAASDSKSGGVEHGARVFSHSTCHHRPEIYSGIKERESAQLLQDFFAARRV